MVDATGWPAATDAVRALEAFLVEFGESTSGALWLRSETLRAEGIQLGRAHWVRGDAASVDVVIELGSKVASDAAIGHRIKVLFGGTALAERFGWDPAEGEPLQVFLVSEPPEGGAGAVRTYGPIEQRIEPGPRRMRWMQLMRVLGLHCALFMRQLVAEVCSPAVTDRPVWSSDAPRPGSLVRFLGEHARGIWRYRVARRPTWRQWSIGIGSIERGADCGSPSNGLTRMSWIVPPTDRFWADPFIVEDDGRIVLFYEEQLRRDVPGTLWCRDVSRSPGVPPGIPRRLELEGHDGSHLSFPFCFRHGGEWYLLPEQSDYGSVTLYRAVDFPTRWRRVRDLLPGVPGIDPVLHRSGGLWWLFCSDGRGGNCDSHLLLFSAPTLEDPFTLHPASPIRCGLRGSRMAGPIRTIDGRLVRFGQDCRRKYGASVVAFDITRIDAAGFSEVESFEIAPTFDPRFPGGIHTITSLPDGGMVAVDSERRVR